MYHGNLLIEITNCENESKLGIVSKTSTQFMHCLTEHKELPILLTNFYLSLYFKRMFSFQILVFALFVFECMNLKIKLNYCYTLLNISY